MKKTALGVVAMLLLAGTAVAAPVSEATAVRVALNFWNTYRPQDVKPVSAMQTLSFPELQNMYVFANDTIGFVIVAADDRVRPVLGYSFDSPFPQRQLHPELNFWLSIYEDQIAYAATLNRAADPRWNSLLTAVPPAQPLSLSNVPVLCKTRWNQDDPFNRLCPYDTVYHKRTVVGCVATAMAQIMKRWNHPSCGTGHHSYEHHPMWPNTTSYGTLSADFEHTTYMWELMPNSVMIATTQQKAHALSVLSYHCGIAVDMMYGPSATGGSGAYSSCDPYYWNCDSVTAFAENAFSEHFKYSEERHFEQRNKSIWSSSSYSMVDSTLISDSVWLAMIDEELAHGRPMYYSGSDNSGGHAFVLDGSNLDTCYHFNWGWGGSGDGYYAMNNLAPGSGGAGGNVTYTFNQGQGAIFGIQPIPETFDTIELYDTVCTNYTVYENYGYTLPLVSCDTNLRYLDTIIKLHLQVDEANHVTYSSNSSGFGQMVENTYCHADGVEMIECPFTRNGYYFIGWSTENAGPIDTLYQPGQVVFLQGNAVLFARWKKRDSTPVLEVEDDVVGLWPNPTTGEITVTLRLGHEAQILVIDAMGRTVLREDYPNMMNGGAKLSLQELPDGIYTLQVKTEVGAYNRRIIKQ